MTEKPQPTIRWIAEQVCLHRRISIGQMLSRAVTDEVAHARQEVMWIANVQAGYSLPKIGAALNRHHTAVLAGVRAVTNRILHSDDTGTGYTADFVSMAEQIAGPVEDGIDRAVRRLEGRS